MRKNNGVTKKYKYEEQMFCEMERSLIFFLFIGILSYWFTTVLSSTKENDHLSTTLQSEDAMWCKDECFEGGDEFSND